MIFVQGERKVEIFAPMDGSVLAPMSCGSRVSQDHGQEDLANSGVYVGVGMTIPDPQRR